MMCHSPLPLPSPLLTDRHTLVFCCVGLGLSGKSDYLTDHLGHPGRRRSHTAPSLVWFSPSTTGKGTPQRALSLVCLDHQSQGGAQQLASLVWTCRTVSTPPPQSYPTSHMMKSAKSSASAPGDVAPPLVRSTSPNPSWESCCCCCGGPVHCPSESSPGAAPSPLGAGRSTAAAAPAASGGTSWGCSPPPLAPTTAGLSSTPPWRSLGSAGGGLPWAS
mmetsp:Transcript_3030/g.8706  ORF Transcript_3030/g.8706 Transcript_3030/m.8706 type:complete len:218 (+) Transcript_3030:60-713(+)